MLCGGAAATCDSWSTWPRSSSANWLPVEVLPHLSNSIMPCGQLPYPVVCSWLLSSQKKPAFMLCLPRTLVRLSWNAQIFFWLPYALPKALIMGGAYRLEKLPVLLLVVASQLMMLGIWSRVRSAGCPKGFTSCIPTVDIDMALLFTNAGGKVK